MKNMKVLIDTNVIIDFLIKREPYYDDARKILLECVKENNEGYIAMHTVSNIWYMLRKESPEKRRKCLKIICLALKVCFSTHIEVYNAIKNDKFTDFEDALQESCAFVNKVDYIVTRNVKDFKYSRIQVLEPKKFLDIHSC